MSSSDDRRRPRVAGQRRRTPRPVPASSTPVVEDAVADHGAVAGLETGAPAATPVTSPDAVSAPVPDRAAHPVQERQPGPRPSAQDAPTMVRRRGGVRRDLVAPLVALVLAVVALALVASVSLQDPGVRERDARAATAAARADLEQLLSYDHETIAAQAERNSALLTGPFKDEYATTMRTKIAPVAQKEKAVVRARSYEAGVMRQGEDTVTVQVFLNQAKTSQGQEQPSVDQNRVIATMQRVGGRWLIARLSAY